MYSNDHHVRVAVVIAVKAVLVTDSDSVVDGTSSSYSSSNCESSVS
jgi:hypothetical protein